MERSLLKHLMVLLGFGLCALFLAFRLLYIYINSSERYPINTVQIIASNHYIPRQKIAEIVSPYGRRSFLTLATSRLRAEILELSWADEVKVERVWPDILKVVVVEKRPMAIIEGLEKTKDILLMTEDGELIIIPKIPDDLVLPKLSGPKSQYTDLLAAYKKLSKIMVNYGLAIKELNLRENQAWDLTLQSGVKVNLGKQDIEKRVLRFCRSYPAIFADKGDKILSVDLRYANGMAVN
jgi:cell division protein FtsQ